MSKQIEAMKLALEALENTTPTGFSMERDKQFFAAITALREALAEQPAREWVGLTEDEFDDLRDNNFGVSPLISAVEAKLKEKNT